MTSDNRFAGMIGEEYDLFRLAVPHHDELQEELKRLVQLYYNYKHRPYPFKVLEIGCGTGLTTRRILEAGSGITVLAIDNEPTMIEQARQELAPFGDRVTLVCDDVLHYLLHQEGGKWFTYSAVASAFTLHNFDHDYRVSLIRCIKNQLRLDHGVYINADKYARDDKTAHARDLREQIDAFAVFDGVGRPDLREHWTQHYLEDEETRWDEYHENLFLNLSGFTNIECTYRERMEAVFVATCY